jgi:hypothetical protein
LIEVTSDEKPHIINWFITLIIQRIVTPVIFLGLFIIFFCAIQKNFSFYSFLSKTWNYSSPSSSHIVLHIDPSPHPKEKNFFLANPNTHKHTHTHMHAIMGNYPSSGTTAISTGVSPSQR